MKFLAADPGVLKEFRKLFDASSTNLVGAIMASVCTGVAAIAIKRGLDWRDMNVIDQIYQEKLAGHMFYQVLQDPKTGLRYRIKMLYEPTTLAMAKRLVNEVMPKISKRFGHDQSRTFLAGTLALCTALGRKPV